MPKKRSSTLLLVLVIYFLVHALMRTALGWSLTTDEVSIIRDAQSFSWIYSGEMPLYAWLQSAVFSAFGTTVLSLTVLKNAILLLICLSIFTLVERVSSPAYAFAATISMLFIPQLVWTSQHSMTAPVLATLFAATTLLSFSRLQEERNLVRYGLLGAMIGLGAISSLTYYLVPAALIPAALTSTHHRKIILNKGIFVTILVALIIAVWPYVRLFQANTEMLPDLSTLHPIGIDLIINRARGMYDALQTILAFSSLLIVAAALTIYSGLGRNQSINEETLALRELLLRTVTMGLLVVFGVAFVSGGAWMDQASLQPLLFLVAPLLALYLFPAMSTKTHRQAVNVSAIIAVAVLVITPAHYSFGTGSGGSLQQAAYLPIEDIQTLGSQR